MWCAVLDASRPLILLFISPQGAESQGSGHMGVGWGGPPQPSFQKMK